MLLKRDDSRVNVPLPVERGKGIAAVAREEGVCVGECMDGCRAKNLK